MIELRWAYRDGNDRIPFLQYRTWSGPKVVLSADSSRVTYDQGEWSEWTMVPTVRLDLAHP